jgi:hypothetical protein
MKSLFRSKTFWVAVLQGVAGVLALVHPDPTVKTAGGLALVKSGIDVGLRVLTTDPVTVHP